MTAAPAEPLRPPVWAWLPSAAVLGVCGLLTLLVVIGRREPDVAALQKRADAAVAAKDVETTSLTYQHLMAIEPGVPAHVIAYARALDTLGKRTDAVSILGTAAPESGDGEPAAHLLLGDWLLEARVLGAQQNDTAVRRAIRHFDAAMRSTALYREANEQKRLAEELLSVPATQSQ